MLAPFFPQSNAVFSVLCFLGRHSFVCYLLLHFWCSKRCLAIGCKSSVGVGLVSGRGGSYLLVSGCDCCCCRTNDSMVARRMQSILLWWSALSGFVAVVAAPFQYGVTKRSVTFMAFRYSCDFALLPLSLFYGCCFSLHTLKMATAGNILFLIYRCTDFLIVYRFCTEHYYRSLWKTQ